MIPLFKDILQVGSTHNQQLLNNQFLKYLFVWVCVGMGIYTNLLFGFVFVTILISSALGTFWNRTYYVQNRVLRTQPFAQTALQSAAAESLVGIGAALESQTLTNVSSLCHIAKTEYKYLLNIQYLSNLEKLCSHCISYYGFVWFFPSAPNKPLR